MIGARIGFATLDRMETSDQNIIRREPLIQTAAKTSRIKRNLSHFWQKFWKLNKPARKKFLKNLSFEVDFKLQFPPITDKINTHNISEYSIVFFLLFYKKKRYLADLLHCVQEKIRTEIPDDQTAKDGTQQCFLTVRQSFKHLTFMRLT